MEPHLHVSTPPPKPLMIWDGECHFCARWIERWKQQTGNRVDYLRSQQRESHFREIPDEIFSRTVVLIEPTGEVFCGAEAVCRSLGSNAAFKWLAWSYYHLPGFAPLSEAVYKLIAKNRQLASAGTRLLWGRDVRVPTYYAARQLFLRGLGLVYLIAFISFWVQVDGLIGANGISPVREFLPAAKEQVGTQAPFLLPSLCWFDSSNAFLHFLCGAGAFVSFLLIAGFVPVLCLIFLLVCYLSLTVAGQTFFNFQWDILLLETGFLAIFFAPLGWRLNWRAEAPFSRAGFFLLKLLLFKLMFMSGVVKLTSGDDSWWKLTALDYHYWTQPLPTVPGWWAAQSSEWLKQFSNFAVILIECVAGFFLWAPRRLRFITFVLLVSLQVMIGLTGNYCFFNLLTIVLCILLLDDTQIGSRAVAAVADRDKEVTVQPVTTGTERGYKWFAVIVLVITLPLNVMLLVSAIKPEANWPRLILAIYTRIEPFRIVNGYGLFRVMTKEREEIVLEGSENGRDWSAYEFKWKPGDLMRAPGWVAPHQPRLDWQMWFAALSDYRQNPWFVRFVIQLLKNSPDVTKLLERNPFPNSPPRYIRAILYDYHFTSLEEHRATGAWWKREERGVYLPRISLGTEPFEPSSY